MKECFLAQDVPWNFTVRYTQTTPLVSVVRDAMNTSFVLVQVLALCKCCCTLVQLWLLHWKSDCENHLHALFLCCSDSFFFSQDVP